MINRRQSLRIAAGAAIASVLAAPAVAQARTRLRLGYLHVIAVDGHIWTGLDRGSYDRHGLDFDLFEFNTGPEMFEAMARGHLLPSIGRARRLGHPSRLLRRQQGRLEQDHPRLGGYE